MDFNNNANNHNGYNNGNGYNNNYNSDNRQPYGCHYPPPVRLPGNSLATAAMALGILAIVTTMILPLYLPFILGSLAILFALLSRGSATKLSGKATAGVTCGAIGLTINMAIFGFSTYLLLSNPNLITETAQIYDNMIEQIYGIPSEEFFGESMEDMMKDLFPTY